ncbi:lytic transglycosylase domain-containing protein [Methylobacterium phyllosphaerae]
MRARMFLFTTPSSPPESPPPQARPLPGTAASGPVVQAIRDGAMASGAGFDYLLATARRESALDPTAKAGTSSATGLFQFIEQTWLGVMKNAGPRLGLQAQADAITRQSDGSYTVPDASQRQAILDLRRDPKIAATLAGALTQQNADALTGALGREPTAGDLYAAHVLGAKGAAALIGTARTFPERAAALDLPEAAAASRALFYDRTGRPRSAAELYASLAAAAQGAAATDITGLRQGGAAPAGGLGLCQHGDGVRGHLRPAQPVPDRPARRGVGRRGAALAGAQRRGPGPARGTDLLPALRFGAATACGRPGASGHGCPTRAGGDAAGCRPPQPADTAPPPRGTHGRGTHVRRQDQPVRPPERSMIIREFLAWTQNASAEGRAEATSALARAYLYGDLDADAAWEAKTALLALLDDPSPLVRRALAETCAASARTPRPLVVALSC